MQLNRLSVNIVRWNRKHDDVAEDNQQQIERRHIISKIDI